jgi:hypothetical protein
MPEIGWILALRAGPEVGSRMPYKHHRLSLANIGEARKGAFDPAWASHRPPIYAMEGNNGPGV